MNVCSGDSGGGFVFRKEEEAKYYLRGVISEGPVLCNGKGGYGLFTNVSSYKNLVEKYMKMK